MSRIAHISDLHFGRHDPRLADALLEALARARPDIVALSGDLTQRARRHEFAAARAFMDRLTAPVVAVPGNHDVPLFNLFERLARPMSRYVRLITPDRQPLFADETTAVLGVNTAHGITFKGGRISRRQIGDIREIFASVAPRALKVLVTHHPLLLPSERPGLRPVRRARPVLEAVAAAGVRLLLAGHHHTSTSAELHIEHLPCARSILVIQAGTAISRRLRHEPNSFNLIDADKGRVACAVCVWNGAAFVPAAQRDFALVGEEWRPRSG